MGLEFKVEGPPPDMTEFYLNVGGLYSEVALQKQEAEGTAHTKQQLNREP